MPAARTLGALALLLAACPAKNDTPAPAATAKKPAVELENRVIETIEETTVGDLAGVAVPMGSMLLNDTYALPDGTEKSGVTCNLALSTGGVWVGLGSVVEVGGSQWEIVGIEKERGQPGSVTLAKL